MTIFFYKIEKNNVSTKRSRKKSSSFNGRFFLEGSLSSIGGLFLAVYPLKNIVRRIRSYSPFPRIKARVSPFQESSLQGNFREFSENRLLLVLNVYHHLLVLHFTMKNTVWGGGYLHKRWKPKKGKKGNPGISAENLYKYSHNLDFRNIYIQRSEGCKHFFEIYLPFFSKFSN